MAEAMDTVWLPVLPSFGGFGPALIKGAGKEAEKAGKPVGERFGKALAIGAGVTAGLVGAGTALYKLGEVFDEVTDTIRVGTGATGKDLEGLVDVAKNVSTKVPADFDKIGSTVADVNTRMGLSGDTLDKVASQYLEAGRILGEDVDIMKTGAAFNAFAIEGEDVSDALDHLFRVSQATGIGMNELAGTVQASAPAAKALGFTFEETAGMVGTLDKAGLNSSKMMAGLSKGLVELSKDGEKPADAFKRVVGEMEDFMEKGDEAGAMKIASKIFGTRNAPQFLDAVKSGALELGSLSEVAGMTEDTILGAGKETMDFAEHWQIFKNKIMVALAPLAEKVFGLMGELMEHLSEVVSEHILPAFEGFLEWFEKSSKWVIPLVAAIGGLALVFAGVAKAIALVSTATKVWQAITKIAAGVQMAFNAVLNANPLGLLVLAIAAVVGALVWFFTQTEVGKKAWKGFTDWLQRIFGGLAKWWTETAMPALSEGFEKVSAAISWAWENVLKPVFKALGDFFSFVWEQILQPAFRAVHRGFEVIGAGIQAYWRTVLRPTFRALGDFFKWVWEQVLQPAFKAVRSGYDVLSRGIRTLWQDILRPVFKALGDFFRSVWTEKLQPAFKAVRDGWEGLSKFFSRFWTEGLKPTLSAFGDFVRTEIVDRVKKGVSAIEKAWKKVANFFRTPINWVIRTVFNSGVVKGFNWVTDKLGLKDLKIPSLPQIPAFAEGGYHKGGWALVGEEGPELVNFSNPARIYTAPETREALAGSLNRDLSESEAKAAAGASPAHATLPMGGWAKDAWDWVAEKTKPVVDFVKEGLLAGANALFLDPMEQGMKALLSGGDWLTKTSLGMGTKMLSGLRDWIRGKESEQAEGGDGPVFSGSELGRFARPAHGPITSWYGRRWGGHHAGVDIGTSGKTFAAWDGLVAKTGWNIGPGRTGIGILLSHANKTWSYYGHNPPGGVKVKTGDRVKAGQHIGYGGSTGNATGDHLHWEVHKNRAWADINPRRFLVRDQGGLLPPGLSWVFNGTPGNELVLNQQQMARADLAGRRMLTDQQPTVQIGEVRTESVEEFARILAAELRRTNKIHALAGR